MRRATVIEKAITFYPPAISIHALLAESDQDTREKADRHIISIHALLAESDRKRQRSGAGIGISIHALLAESDSLNLPSSPIDKNISIHALLAESDLKLFPKRLCNTLFLSTLSLRRATRLKPRQTRTDTNFYPRSPCGERRHDPGGGRICQGFLSTLSLRRATTSSR